MQTDNVILLGAGASFDAGIPLMDGFIEKIRYFAFKSLGNNSLLSSSDFKVFQEAIKIMNELDSYHGRAKFNDRNIEDILSILAFNILGGKSYTYKKLEKMVNSISRTIELTCMVKHNGHLDEIQNEGDQVYRDFWNNLFTQFDNGKTFPTIITLNYDLVLERSLLQTLISPKFKGHKFDGIVVRYFYSKTENDFIFKIRNQGYEKHNDDYGIERFSGQALEKCTISELKNPLTIEILKLHGSQNFPSNDQFQVSLTESINNPFIIPPVSNKNLDTKIEKVWRRALERIGNCKNLSIIGYSLPKTDIYFQFFLKASLGPNKEFEKMYIFNPALFNSLSGGDLESRFGDCFPEQLKNQLIFRPSITKNQSVDPGSFKHFVNEIAKNESLLF